MQIPSCPFLARFQSLWIFAVLTLCLATDQAIDGRIPSEVLHKVAYVNPTPPPLYFNSALLWGIAIADIRVPGFENADVKVAWTQLSCSSSSKTVILNDDYGEVHGGLYRRFPWFGTDRHEPMPIIHSLDTSFQPKKVSVLRVGQRPDRVWHFWSASPRAQLPSGKLDGCTAKARVWISKGALLQIGMDYWRNATTPYGSGGNNHEAGVSDWYFPSDTWQEVMFTDIPAALRTKH